MKIVRIKNHFFYLFFLLLIGCGKWKTKKENNPIGIDYQKDSVVYLLDVKNDFEKEKLLVTRQIIVGDSVIGKEEENGIWDKVHRYCDELNEKEADFSCNYKYLYTIFIQEFDKYTKLISYKLDMDNVVILRQGSTNSQFNNYPKSVINDMTYLRIMNLRAEDLNTRSINMYYDEENEQWKILSIERIGIDYFTNKKEVKYCIDTMPYHPNDLYHKKIEWMEWSYYEDCLKNTE